MAKSTQVITGNAMRLAADQYGDATGFVAIMQANQLDDYRVNDPVVVNTLAPAGRGSTVLLFPAVDEIKLGDSVYCSGVNTFVVVTAVEQTRSTQSSTFCTCTSHTVHDRVLPPQGKRLTTIVTISPGLDAAMTTGSEVTFATSELETIVFPEYVRASDGVAT